MGAGSKAFQTREATYPRAQSLALQGQDKDNSFIPNQWEAIECYCCCVKRLYIVGVFSGSFKLTENLSRRNRVSVYLLKLTLTASPTIITSHQSGTFVAVDELILKCHCRPESTTYIQVHSCCCAFCDKCVTCLRHHSIRQSSFRALRVVLVGGDPCSKPHFDRTFLTAEWRMEMTKRQCGE